MEETARDIILELYKKDYITKGETDVLLNAINNVPSRTFAPTPYYTYVDWTYRPYQQPYCAITTNADNTNVE